MFLNGSRWVIFTQINSLHDLALTCTNACVDVMEENKMLGLRKIRPAAVGSNTC